jgi:hypothetical protein
VVQLKAQPAEQTEVHGQRQREYDTTFHAAPACFDRVRCILFRGFLAGIFILPGDEPDVLV